MNKYYKLAMAMEKTRGDWSQGFYRVKNALKDFKIETNLDQIIFNEMSERVKESRYQDGRTFRDCPHNYNWIRDNLLSKEENKKYSIEYTKYLNY